MKVQNPLIGRASQKFSNAIFQTWKGINVVRSKPLEVANPQSQAQTRQRDKFKSMVMLARLALNTIKLGLKSLAIQKSEYNVFISQNIALQDANGEGIPTLDGEEIVLSKGSLSKCNLTNVSIGGDSMSISWSNANRPFSSPNDKVVIGALYGSGGYIKGYVEVTRDVLATAQYFDGLTLGVPLGQSAMIATIFAYNDSDVSDTDSSIHNV